MMKQYILPKIRLVEHLKSDHSHSAYLILGPATGKMYISHGISL